MDIKIKTDTINFVYRTAGIIINENKILMQKNNSFDYITLPGGKCMIGETSVDAIKREIKEEIGVDTEFIRTKAITENLFHSLFDNKDRHELLFINELKILNSFDFSKNIIYNLDDKYDKNQYFEWINIDDLNNYIVKPNYIIDVINSNELVHIISNE